MTPLGGTLGPGQRRALPFGEEGAPGIRAPGQAPQLLHQAPQRRHPALQAFFPVSFEIFQGSFRALQVVGQNLPLMEDLRQGLRGGHRQKQGESRLGAVKKAPQGLGSLGLQEEILRGPAVKVVEEILHHPGELRLVRARNHVAPLPNKGFW